jgi:riboflavin biosynthesis pyrimidine reductase
MRVLDAEGCPDLDVLIADHVAVPDGRDETRAFVRLNMIASADGGSAVSGLSGGLGNGADHEVFAGLRAAADAVLVGMGTALAEHYGPPTVAGQQIYVIANRADVSGNPELFRSEHVTLVLPAAAGEAPAGVRVLRAGDGTSVDLGVLVASLAGKVVLNEGGPSIAGAMVALGLIDEFFLTVSPRVIAGDSARVAHGSDADPNVWELRHGFVDDDGFFFVRYARRRG